MKTKFFSVLLGTVLVTTGCTFAVTRPSTPTTQADQVATIVAATMQALTAAPGSGTSAPGLTPQSGNSISYENVSFVIPSGLASGANSETMTAVASNSGAPWDIAPTHQRFTLTGYQLQGKFHEPRIFVYPAAEYAQTNPGAAESIDRLRKILSGTALLAETLPAVPFFNATPQLAAQIKLVPFESGNGVRTLTQYAQYAAPINNRELFYHFEGLTGDGQYYVIAILPISAPVLAEDENPEASVPSGGVPIPTVVGPNDIYYFSITQKLNTLAQDAFIPSLNMLDALIQSIRVQTP